MKGTICFNKDSATRLDFRFQSLMICVHGPKTGKNKIIPANCKVYLNTKFYREMPNNFGH